MTGGKYPRSKLQSLGRGGGLVVSLLAFYSDDPNSNPACYLNFLHEKMKMNEKEAGVGPSLKKVGSITLGPNSFRTSSGRELKIYLFTNSVDSVD